MPLQEPTRAVDAPAQPAARATRSFAAEAGPAAPVAAPRNAQEVQGLNVRRDMLRQQLERAEEQRGELAVEIREADTDKEGKAIDQSVAAPLRAGLEVRLREVDAHVVQLERDIAATDRALAGASPAVLAQYEMQRPRPPVHTGPDENDVAVGVFGGLFAGMLLMVAARRVRAWRRRGERPAYGAPAGAGPDPRIDRLTQAVDAIAVEVERIGEGQRFVTQLMAERRELVPPEVARTADVPGIR